jgi:hypothetical protein
VVEERGEGYIRSARVYHISLMHGNKSSNWNGTNNARMLSFGIIQKQQLNGI